MDDSSAPGTFSFHGTRRLLLLGFGFGVARAESETYPPKKVPLSGDGDPCDVLIANTRAIIPGAIMSARPVGVMVMQDEGGEDEKIIAVPSRHLTKRYDRVENYTDLPEITIHQIQHFFEHYKDLEPGKWVKFVRWGDKEEAHRLIEEAIERGKAKK